jgi:hypothetical protein
VAVVAALGEAAARAPARRGVYDQSSSYISLTQLAVNNKLDVNTLR